VLLGLEPDGESDAVLPDRIGMIELRGIHGRDERFDAVAEREAVAA
jgi:hypothetical protein